MSEQKYPSKKANPGEKRSDRRKSTGSRKNAKQRKSSEGKQDFKNLPANKILKGKSGRRYRIRRKLGEGGMGAVYEGEDTRTTTRCAIKCEGRRRYRAMHLQMEVSLRLRSTNRRV